MKKFTALLLALIMVFSLATVASAAEINDKNEADYTDKLDKGTTFTKEYIVNSGKAPAEKFVFTVEYEGFVNQDGEKEDTEKTPTVTIGTADFEAKEAGTYTATADVTITGATDCALGVYTYKITETDAGVAGVDYVAEPVYLVVTVLRDENSQKHYVAAIHYEKVDGSKTDKTTNDYDAGSLNITKEITGNMADMTKEFPIKVTFTPQEGDHFVNVNDVQIVNNGTTAGIDYSYTSNDDGTVTVTFTLTNGESAEFTNIPSGTTYVVEETDLYGYTQTKAEGVEGVVDDATVGKSVSGTVEDQDTDNTVLLRTN